MKAKSIGKEIKKKVNAWLETIDNKQLAKDLAEGVIVTGGCITSMFLQEKVNDYDIYLTSPQLAYRVACYYLKFTGDNGDVMIRCHAEDGTYEDIEVGYSLPANTERVEIYIPSSGNLKNKPEKGTKYSPVFFTGNAITLANKIQIVLRFTGTPKQVHETYDFVHATNYWTMKDGLVTNVDALQCILAKELKYRGSRYPLASIFRTRKFIQRGWTCHVGNYIKMAMQLNELNLKWVPTLQDQLTGVDAIFMKMLIDALKDKVEVDTHYVCELIEKIMD